MTTTILHVSDTHLGKRQYRSDVRRKDFTDAFDNSAEIAIESGVDAVVHTGDLFDRKNPSVSTIVDCLDILSKLRDNGISFYAIVGNHERKNDVQWLDIFERSDAVKRLGTSPEIVGNIALYGIDAVTKYAWEHTDFTLEEPNGDYFRILCMHQLLHPPVPEHFADYPTDDVLRRLNINVDALALGDYHESVSEVVKGVKVWYAGSTEYNARDEAGSPRTVSLIKVEDGNLSKREIKIDAREFVNIKVKFREGDGLDRVREELDERDIEGKVAVVELAGEPSSVTSKEVYNELESRGAAATNVMDTRKTTVSNEYNVSNTEVSEIENLIDDKIAEAEIGDATKEIDSVVRDGDVPKSQVREKSKSILHDRMEDGGDV